MGSLLRFWREFTIGALALSLVVGGRLWWTAHERAAEERGRLMELNRVADSTLKAVRPQLARVDTLVQRDTVKVRVAIDRVVTLRDTLLQRLTDTVTLLRYIERTDSALAACSELSRDCAAFRLYANQTIGALETKLKVQPAFVARGCTGRSLLAGVIGATVGVVAGRTAFKP